MFTIERRWLLWWYHINGSGLSEGIMQLFLWSVAIYSYNSHALRDMCWPSGIVRQGTSSEHRANSGIEWKFNIVDAIYDYTSTMHQHVCDKYDSIYYRYHLNCVHIWYKWYFQVLLSGTPVSRLVHANHVINHPSLVHILVHSDHYFMHPYHPVNCLFKYTLSNFNKHF